VTHTANAVRKLRLPLRGTVPTLALLALALAGCGSSSNSTSSATSTPAAAAPTTSTPAASTPAAAAGAAGTLKLEANPEGQLKFNTTSLTAKAGSVTVDFKNASPLAHNVTIASSSGTIVGQTPTFESGAKTLTVSLKAGVYKFYCSVPGHRQAGMEGTLIVQ
jgi:plastocyanin